MPNIWIYQKVVLTCQAGKTNSCQVKLVKHKMENMTLIHEIQLYYRIDLIVFMTDMPVFHKNKNVVFGFIRQIICCIVSYDAHVCVLLFLGMIGYTLNWKYRFFCFKVSL